MPLFVLENERDWVNQIPLLDEIGRIDGTLMSRQLTGLDFREQAGLRHSRFVSGSLVALELAQDSYCFIVGQTLGKGAGHQHCSNLASFCITIVVVTTVAL